MRRRAVPDCNSAPTLRVRHSFCLAGPKNKMNYIFKYDMLHGLSGSHTGGARRPHQPTFPPSRVRSRSLKPASVTAAAAGVLHQPAHRSKSPTGSMSFRQMEEVAFCMQMIGAPPERPVPTPYGDPFGAFLDTRRERAGGMRSHHAHRAVHTKGCGEILIQLCHEPVLARLTVIVVRARDLQPKDISGSADPYVSVWLVVQNTKVECRRTACKPHTTSPNYEESFTFNVAADARQTVQLICRVFDRSGMGGSSEEIGHISIGTVPNQLAKKHWSEIFKRPGKPVSMWHRLSPPC